MSGPVPAPAAKPRRVWKVLLLLCAGFLLALVLAGPSLVAAIPAVRQALASEMEKALGRPVSIRGMDLGLLGGLRIGLDGVEVRDLGSVGRLDLELALFPLLKEKASVRRVAVRDGTYHHREGPLPFDVEGIDLDLKAEGLVLEPGLDPMALLQRTTLDATASVSSVRAKGIDLSNLACRLSLEKGVARLMEGKAGLNGGTAAFSASADMQAPRKPACAVRMDLSGVQADSGPMGLPVLFKGEVAKAGADIRWKGLDRESACASVEGGIRVKVAARTIDFSALLPKELSAAKDLVLFTALEGDVSLGNGVSTHTLLLSAPGNGIKLTGTTRLSDQECDFTVQPTGRLGDLAGGRALFLNGPLHRLQLNSARMMEKEARRLLEDQLKEKALEGLGKLLP